MESNFNKLLTRQLKRHFGSVDNLPEELKGIIQDINNTYENFEDDTTLLQNSIEISSQELRNAFQKHKQDAEDQKLTINRIKEAILAIQPASPHAIAETETTASESSYLFESLIKLIEERKTAEEEILKLSKAVEQNPASIVITDIYGNIEYVNPKFCNLTGYTKEESLGNNPRILKSDSTPPEYFKNLWETIISGKEWSGELQNKKKNGEIYWESALISPIFNEHKKITHFIAIKEDITERKLAEAERIRQSGLITSLLDSIPDIIFFKDTQGVYLGCNPPFAEFVGKPKNEIVGKTDFDLFDPKIASSFRQFDIEMLKHKKSQHNEEWITYPDGRKILIDTLKTPYWASDGSLIGILGVSRDITKRKEAEEALLTKTSLLEAQTDATIDAILVIDMDQKRVLINQRAIELFEIPQPILENEDDSLLLKHVVGLTKYPEKFLEKVIYLYDHNKEISQDEIEFKSGMVLDRYSAPVLGKDGKNYGRIWTFRDITKTKQAEEEIRRHAGLISSLLDSIPDLIFFKDLNGVYMGGNPAFAKFCGRSVVQIAGMTDFDIFDDEIAESFLEQDKDLMTHRKPSHKDVWITYPDKTKILVDTLKTPYLGPDGELIGVLGISRDITARKQAEENLENERTLFRTIIDLIPDAVYVKDTEGRKIIANPKEVELVGKNSEEEIIGFTDFNLLSKDEAEYSQGEDQFVLSTGNSILDIDSTMFDKDGIQHWLLGSKVALRDIYGKITGIVGITHDISEQKKTEAVLLNAKLEAEMANKSKSIFLANMSHEIRTPLNAIIGFSQLMNRDPLLTASQKEYNVSIIRAGEHLLMLINDILELSKVEAGRVVINPTNIDLFELIDDIQMIFKERVDFKNLQFIVESANNLPRFVWVDEQKLRQIFINLIGNAIKFTDEGGIALRVRYDKKTENTGLLVVEIQDSGHGIADHELNILFKHFAQTASGIKKSSGTGLGLALSREFAILMGGNISVESQLGKGSVFTFYVAIKEGNSDTVKGTVAKRVTGILNLQKAIRILVVDDKEENLQVAVRLLQLVGFETMEAVNGKDAIEKFEQWNPDLILMDIRMPVMDGFEASRLIKLTEKGKETPIIALTASSFEDERKKIEALGMQGYIRKPFRENEFFNCIGKSLDIQYIYEMESALVEKKIMNDQKTIHDAIVKLPDTLVAQMADALAVADLDLLILLLKSIETENPELAQHLLAHANDYDYAYLQQLLKQHKQSN